MGFADDFDAFGDSLEGRGFERRMQSRDGKDRFRQFFKPTGNESNEVFAIMDTRTGNVQVGLHVGRNARILHSKTLPEDGQERLDYLKMASDWLVVYEAIDQPDLDSAVSIVFGHVGQTFGDMAGVYWSHDNLVWTDPLTMKDYVNHELWDVSDTELGIRAFLVEEHYAGNNADMTPRP